MTKAFKYKPLLAILVHRLKRIFSVISFTKSLLASLAVLGILAFLCAKLIPSYRLVPGVAGLCLMALNAFAAIAVLHMPGQRDILRTSITSMATRLLALAAIMIAAMQIFKPTQPEAFSFVFTAMAGYVAFQTLEIRHFIRLQSRWAK